MIFNPFFKNNNELINSLISYVLQMQTSKTFDWFKNLLRLIHIQYTSTYMSFSVFKIFNWFKKILITCVHMLSLKAQKRLNKVSSHNSPKYGWPTSLPYQILNRRIKGLKLQASFQWNYYNTFSCLLGTNPKTNDKQDRR